MQIAGRPHSDGRRSSDVLTAQQMEDGRDGLRVPDNLTLAQSVQDMGDACGAAGLPRSLTDRANSQSRP
jgi:hypothetical protein